MSAVTGLAAEAAAFMKRAGYSSSSRSGYQRIWDQFGRYCAASGVRVPDRESAAGFFAAVGADGAAQWQVFCRRAVGCLFDVADTSRFALRAGRGGIPVPEIFTVEFEAYASSLAGRGLAEATVRAKTGMLRRFLAFLAGQGVQRMTALSVADVSAYVRSLTPMAASSRAGQLYFLREYLRFAVREHGADPVLGAMFPVIVFDRDAVLPSVYRPGEVAAALAEAGNQSESPLRDRAVLLLASLLGLRSGDIRGLRFHQIETASQGRPGTHRGAEASRGASRSSTDLGCRRRSRPPARGLCSRARVTTLRSSAPARGPHCPVAVHPGRAGHGTGRGAPGASARSGPDR